MCREVTEGLHVEFEWDGMGWDDQEVSWWAVV
jgi:hypothetical protein